MSSDGRNRVEYVVTEASNPLTDDEWAGLAQGFVADTYRHHAVRLTVDALDALAHGDGALGVRLALLAAEVAKIADYVESQPPSLELVEQAAAMLNEVSAS